MGERGGEGREGREGRGERGGEGREGRGGERGEGRGERGGEGEWDEFNQSPRNKNACAHNTPAMPICVHVHMCITGL